MGRYALMGFKLTIVQYAKPFTRLNARIPIGYFRTCPTPNYTELVIALWQTIP